MPAASLPAPGAAARGSEQRRAARSAARSRPEQQWRRGSRGSRLEKGPGAAHFGGHCDCTARAYLAARSTVAQHRGFAPGPGRAGLVPGAGLAARPGAGPGLARGRSRLMRRAGPRLGQGHVFGRSRNSAVAETPPTNQPASPPNRHPTNTPFIQTNRPARGTRPELQQNSRAAPLGTPPRLTRNLNSPRTRAGRGFARTHSNCSNPIGIQSELDRASALRYSELDWEPSGTRAGVAENQS